MNSLDSRSAAPRFRIAPWILAGILGLVPPPAAVLAQDEGVPMDVPAEIPMDLPMDAPMDAPLDFSNFDTEAVPMGDTSGGGAPMDQASQQSGGGFLSNPFGMFGGGQQDQTADPDQGGGGGLFGLGRVQDAFGRLGRGLGVMSAFDRWADSEGDASKGAAADLIQALPQQEGVPSFQDFLASLPEDRRDALLSQLSPQNVDPRFAPVEGRPGVFDVGFDVPGGVPGGANILGDWGAYRAGQGAEGPLANPEFLARIRQVADRSRESLGGEPLHVDFRVTGALSGAENIRVVAGDVRLGERSGAPRLQDGTLYTSASPTAGDATLGDIFTNNGGKNSSVKWERINGRDVKSTRYPQDPYIDYANGRIVFPQYVESRSWSGLRGRKVDGSNTNLDVWFKPGEALGGEFGVDGRISHVTNRWSGIGRRASRNKTYDTANWKVPMDIRGMVSEAGSNSNVVFTQRPTLTTNDVRGSSITARGRVGIDGGATAENLFGPGTPIRPQSIFIDSSGIGIRWDMDPVGLRPAGPPSS